MIQRIFLLAISLTLLYGGGGVCHDDYTPDSFESASDEFAELVDEYIESKGLSISPNEKLLKSRGFIREHHSWILPNCSNKKIRCSGVWRVDVVSDSIIKLYISIPFVEKLSQIDAFNRLNGRVGDIFADFDDGAYEMIMKPEDMRVRYRDRYFEVNGYIYGVDGDDTGLSKTVADIVLTDYTRWVEDNMECNNR